MATHDYVIANGTGAAVRADLNDALAAIVSNNSSSSSPATTYAHQFWADTNTGRLKIRNAANSGWITLRELDGTALMPDGSPGLPGLSFANDLDTGIFRNSDNQIAFSTGGVERLEIADSVVRFNDGGNDVDFRVESSNNTHMLFIDAGNDRVGINTNSPDEIFEVQSASNTTIRIDNEDDSTAKVLFHNTGSTDRQIAVTSGAMTFGGTTEEFARIDNDGRLLAGVTSSTSINRVVVQGATSGSSGQFAIARSNNTPGDGTALSSLNFATSLHETVAKIVCQRDGGTWTASSSYPTRLTFSTTANGGSSSAERMRITNGGDILFGTTATPDGTSDYGSGFISSTNSRMLLKLATSSSATNALLSFHNPNGTVGTIKTSGSSTAYNTTSDYRLKENVVAITDGITRVKQLAPRRFNFIADAETTLDGFLAHEAQTVVPEAVTGAHNGVEVWEEGEELPDGVSVGDNKLDGDGNTIPDYQGIDQSKLVPLLTAALQEAIAKIETLETKVAALEAG